MQIPQISTFEGDLPRRGRVSDELTMALELAIDASAATGEAKIIRGLENAEIARVAQRLRTIASNKKVSMSIFRKSKEGALVFRVNPPVNGAKPTVEAPPEVAPAAPRKRTTKKTAPRARSGQNQ